MSYVEFYSFTSIVCRNEVNTKRFWLDIGCFRFNPEVHAAPNKKRLSAGPG